MDAESPPREVSAPAPHQAQDNRTKPIVACLRCRNHKLKCDRELPSCERCHKQKAVCRYPPPPDRKRIAQKISRRSAASLVDEQQQIHIAGSSEAAKPGKRHHVISHIGEDCIPKSEDTGVAELPSTEVGLLLLEVYFKRVYNAKLLFHKSVAFELYRRDCLPGFLLRSMFAHAAIFLKQVDNPLKKYIKIFPVHTLFEKSWSWARSASQEVLSHADEPSLVRIQALQVLQLYYFSQGEIQRAVIHASLSYRLSQILGYDNLFENDASPPLNRIMLFDREMSRRCFWASWCSFHIGSKELDFSEACERVTGLPLPARFNKEGSGHKVELGRKMGSDWKLSNKFSPNHRTATSSSCSLMAELVKLLGIWTKVRVFISDSSMRSDPQRGNQFDKLVELFDSIESSMQLPLTDLCSQAEIYNESPELLASVYSMYYLSRILMHASMVPIFSGCSTDLPASRDSVRENAEMVLQQAIGFAELLQQFVAKDLDMTRLWHFTGYVAFVAGTVFLVYKSRMQSTRSVDHWLQVPGPDSEEMETIQAVLEVLSIYWKPLSKLATRLQKAIDGGQSEDADLINSSTYPWNIRRSGYSLEDHGDTVMSDSNNVNPNVPLLQNPNNSLLSEDQLLQDFDGHENGTAAYRNLAEEQGKATTETPFSQAPESWYQSDCSRTSVNFNEGSLFDGGWWDSAAVANGWEYPLSLAEMPSRDSMS